jgi:hypothetical protein
MVLAFGSAGAIAPNIASSMPFGSSTRPGRLGRQPESACT